MIKTKQVDPFLVMMYRRPLLFNLVSNEALSKTKFKKKTRISRLIVKQSSFTLHHNTGQNIWNKGKKSSNIEQD